MDIVFFSYLLVKFDFYTVYATGDKTRETIREMGGEGICHIVTLMDQINIVNKKLFLIFYLDK